METLFEAYLENLSDFIGSLRAQGFPIGIAETMDAARMIDVLGAADREQLKGALRSLLAKSEQEQVAFSELFDAYFVPRKIRQQREETRAQEEYDREKKLREADEELDFNGEPLNIRQDLKDIYIQLPDKEKERLQHYLETFEDSIRRSPNLYRSFMRNLIEQQLMAEDAAAHTETPMQADDLLRKNISDFKDTDIPRAVKLLAQLAKQINGELSSRRRKHGTSGTLDFKRTIRSGLETGGIFLRLHYKRRNKRKKRLVILCDVSASMVQFSEFAIRFIKSMSDISDYSDTFLFSEDLLEVDAFSLQNMDLFASHVKNSGLWGKGTDIGKALDDLLSRKPPILGPSTVLMIISDAKTIDLHRAEVSLEKASRVVGQPFWLNPIPADKWQYSKSITSLARHCRMMSCSTLEDLAHACASLGR